MKKIIIVFILIITLVMIGYFTYKKTSADQLSLNNNSSDFVDDNEEVESEDNTTYIYRYQSLDKLDEHSLVDCIGTHRINSLERTLQQGEDRIFQTMRLLFNGEVSEKEKEDGYFGSPFSDKNFEITNMTMNDEGVLFIDLKDEEKLLNMGECWGSIFTTSIFRTGSQFSEVKKVKFEKYYDISLQ